MNLRKRKTTFIDQEQKKRVGEIDQVQQQKKKQMVSKISQVQKKKDRVRENDQLHQKKKKQRVSKISQVQNSKKNHLSSPRPHLPEELIIDSILTRIPARDLAVCSCVSKLWYNSIYNDKQFAANHFVQNKNKLRLVFNLINVGGDSNKAYFFGIEESYNWYDEYEYHNFMSGCAINLPSSDGLVELVGYCNGLACLTPVTNAPDCAMGVILVVNPTKFETLPLTYLYPSGEYVYLCHGFGFDTSTQEYKVVVIFTSAANDEFVCMVITLGTKLWRTIATTTVEIIRPPGSSPLPSRMVTRVSSSRQATLCGGDLFWRITNEAVVVNEEEDILNDSHHEIRKFEMLLSFDLHSEKIQFVRLPAEIPKPAENEHQYLDHFLEFKGYPCIARSEKINNSDYRRHRCSYNSSFCWCCCKVHMYILKDMVKQVWVKEETFDVQIKDQDGLLPASFCCYFAMPPPTRILSFSDQVLLYWFDGKCLVVYNLHTKHLKVIKGSSCSSPDLFGTKMNEFHARGIGCDVNICCLYTDYQLHAQVENIVSLKNLHS